MRYRKNHSYIFTTVTSEPDQSDSKGDCPLLNPEDFTFESKAPEESEAPAESDSTDYRAMLDEYEDFMNKCCDFMEKYSNGSGDTLSMAADYAEMMSQYSGWAEKMDAVDESELSDEDAQYYIEVQTRINRRLLEIGQD